MRLLHALSPSSIASSTLRAHFASGKAPHRGPIATSSTRRWLLLSGTTGAIRHLSVAKPRILVARELTEDAMAALEKETRVDFIRTGIREVCPKDTMIRYLKESAPISGIILTLTEKVDQEILDAAGPSLKAISTMSVGYEHIPTPLLKERSIRLGYTPDVLTDAVAEIAVGLVLAACRKFRDAEEELRAGKWGAWNPTWMAGMGLTGKTVGIVGLGSCGVEVARRLVPFKVGRFVYQGTRPHADKERTLTPPGATFYSSLDEMLPLCDVLVITCALTPQTQGIINYGRLKLLPKGAVVVNVARGGIVVQPDLVRVVREGHLGGVGLDVMTPEPLPMDDELLRLPGMTLLPHLGSATRETREEMSQITINNAVNGVLGEPMPAELKL
ncbi:Glyoxylate reductase [Gonapodya prolifera JEL478]|uniref:Glyoxylate reductase n=1 Tax=Gonapodya prolifera (strain JEL478) TaxID=1344416 RepID=A0A139A694_GONPJ|nr:Glyoxylate reductase [Gonapodya prolifera JEL478]|eukprot:KXS12178.1 Glyoxylate reductase [Gonapodya prolifera JEL478]